MSDSATNDMNGGKGKKRSADCLDEAPDHVPGEMTSSGWSYDMLNDDGPYENNMHMAAFLPGPSRRNVAQYYAFYNNDHAYEFHDNNGGYYREVATTPPVPQNSPIHHEAEMTPPVTLASDVEREFGSNLSDSYDSDFSDPPEHVRAERMTVGPAFDNGLAAMEEIATLRRTVAILQAENDQVHALRHTVHTLQNTVVLVEGENRHLRKTIKNHEERKHLAVMVLNGGVERATDPQDPQDSDTDS